MSEQLWWYVARSGGIVALALAALSVIWGLLASTRIMRGTPSPRWILDLHRFLGGASVVFTAVHVAALVLDRYVSFGVTDVLVPFASSWRPGAVAWGIVAAYLLVAVQVTSVFMRHIPRRWWKGIHLASYGVYWAGIVHGATAGTDAGHPLYVGSVALSILVVLHLTVHRALTARRRPSRPVVAA